MYKTIKDLSNKMVIMETKRRRPNNTNPNQFRRPFNPPQLLQRERWTEDQPIQAPLKNDNMIDDSVKEEFEELDEEVNMIEGDTSYLHLTQDESKKYLSFNQYFDEEDNNNQTEISHHNKGYFCTLYKLNFIRSMISYLEQMEQKQIIKVSQKNFLIRTKVKKCQHRNKNSIIK